MSEKRSFSYSMIRLRGREQRDLLETLHARLSGEDGSEPILTGGREARKFLNALGRKVEAGRSERINQRDDVEDLVDAVFEPALARRDDPEAAAEALQTLRSILGGNWHSPFRPYSYGITEPTEDDPDYGWKSQGATAREMQRRLRISVRAVNNPGSLRGLRGVVLRRGAGISEIMLAGAARERGLAVASDGMIAADIPACDNLYDALHHVQSLATASTRGTERPEGDEEVLHEDHLEILMRGVGEAAGLAALRARCLVLETALTEARDAAIRTSDQEALRHADLSDLVRGTEIEKSYFEIYANRSRAQGHPEEVEALARAQRRILRLEERIMELGKSKPDDGIEPGPT